MAVTFDANFTSDTEANAVTSITTSKLTVGSGSNRALVIQLAWSVAVSSITVTWDQGGTNQSASLITGATATNTQEGNLWGLIAPTSGAKSLKVAWTTTADACVNAVSWTSVDQTGGATSFPHGTGATGNTTTPTATVTSATGNAVMAVFACNTNFSSVNNTQTFLDNSGNNISGAGNRAAGSASVSMTASFSTTQPWAAAGTDIFAFSGGGGPSTAQELPAFIDYGAGMVGQAWQI